MKSILLGAVGVAVIALIAAFVLDYGGPSSDETFKAPESVRLD